MPLRACRISSAVHSTTLPPLRKVRGSVSGAGELIAIVRALDKWTYPSIPARRCEMRGEGCVSRNVRSPMRKADPTGSSREDVGGRARRRKDLLAAAPEARRDKVDSGAALQVSAFRHVVGPKPDSTFGRRAQTNFRNSRVRSKSASSASMRSCVSFQSASCMAAISASMMNSVTTEESQAEGASMRA